MDIVSEVFNGFDSTWKSVNENKAQVLKNHLERTNPKGSVVAESNHVNMSPYASFFVLDLIQTAPHQQEAVPLQPPTSTGVNVNPVALVQTNQRSDQNQFLLTQNISQTFHGQSSTQQQPDDIFPTLELDDFLSNCFT